MSARKMSTGTTSSGASRVNQIAAQVVKPGDW